MLPWLIPGLASLGSGLVGGLLGGGRDPYKEYLRRAQQILNPQAILGDTGQFYQGFLNSPAYSQAQSGILGAGNSLMNRTALGLANRGLFNTGIGQILPGLASSSVANQLGSLQAGGWESALQRAMALRSQLAGMVPQTNPNQLGSSLMGAGISGLGDILKAYLAHAYPQRTQ